MPELSPRRVDQSRRMEPALPSRTRAEVYNSAILPWEKIKKQIMRVEEEAFAAYEPDEAVMQQELIDPTNTVILLRSTEKDNRDEIVGYVFASPLEKSYPRKAKTHPNTAYIPAMGIRPDYQNETGVDQLLRTLEEELVKKGYQAAETHLVIAEAMDPEQVDTHGSFTFEDNRFMEIPEGTRFAKRVEEHYRQRDMIEEAHDEIDNGSELDEVTGDLIDEGTGDLMRFVRVKLN